MTARMRRKCNSASRAVAPSPHAEDLEVAEHDLKMADFNAPKPNRGSCDEISEHRLRGGGKNLLARIRIVRLRLQTRRGQRRGIAQRPLRASVDDRQHADFSYSRPHQIHLVTRV